MSHYTRVGTKISRVDCLKKALINMGFKEHMIEISDTPMNLKGYHGDTREQRANVRIKGSGWKGENYVGGASNDLGWERMEDGTYALHVSDYDVNKYNQAWQTKLMQEYSREVVKEVATEQHLYCEEEKTENGEIYLRLTSPY